MPRYQDALAVRKPEPGMGYRWLADDPERLSLHLVGDPDMPGYKIVQGKNVPETKKLAAKLGFSEGYVNELTNRIQYGRLILGQIPKIAQQARQRELRTDLLDLLGRREEEATEKMKRAGVNPIVGEAEEFEDKKQFATRESDNRVFVTKKIADRLAAATKEDEAEVSGGKE